VRKSGLYANTCTNAADVEVFIHLRGILLFSGESEGLPWWRPGFLFGLLVVRIRPKFHCASRCIGLHPVAYINKLLHFYFILHHVLYTHFVLLHYTHRTDSTDFSCFFFVFSSMSVLTPLLCARLSCPIASF